MSREDAPQDAETFPDVAKLSGGDALIPANPFRSERIFGSARLGRFLDHVFVLSNNGLALILCWPSRRCQRSDLGSRELETGAPPTHLGVEEGSFQAFRLNFLTEPVSEPDSKDAQPPLDTVTLIPPGTASRGQAQNLECLDASGMGKAPPGNRRSLSSPSSGGEHGCAPTS